MVLREDIKLEWTTLDGFKQYTGPQNARELMKDVRRGLQPWAFKDRGERISVRVAGIKITSYSSKLTLSEIDTRYPRAKWLQMLLDRGITIGNTHDYSRYLSKRHTLALLEDNPNLRQSEDSQHSTNG